MPENERKAWAKPWAGPKAIGAYVARLLDPVARARGFATTALLSEWPAVVGAELARFTMPEKVLWPRRFEDRDAASAQSAWRAEGATLVLKVDGPRAIEVQHRAEQILERVNTYFGYRAIGQLRFLQAPVSRAAMPPPDPSPPIDETVLPDPGAFADKGLAQALMRLGTGVRSKDQED
ncbi:MAG: DUF721 domain-containing protein [Methyloceanibacter sp.]|jgi:hypothetical protein